MVALCFLFSLTVHDIQAHPSNKIRAYLEAVVALFLYLMGWNLHKFYTILASPEMSAFCVVISALPLISLYKL